MRRKLSVLGVVATLALGLMVFIVPPDAQADPFTVDRITITVGTNVWCAGIAGACTGVVAGGGALLATLPGAGVLLNQGQTLVLTQTGGGTTFNFDTSDFCPGGTCANPVLNVRTNLTGPAGVNFVDTGRILAPGIGGVDPINATFNEAHDWNPTFPPGLSGANFIDVAFGYADNLHSNACADADANCLPENPFLNATNVFGQGASGVNTGVPAGGTGTHCNAGAATFLCFDSAAILIENSQRVPEPATLLLIGAGLLGMSAYRRGRVKKNR